jgi:hypothetical protein
MTQICIYFVLTSCISWLVVHKSLFFTIYNNKENIYCEYRSKFVIFKQLSTRVSVSGICNDSNYSFLNRKYIIIARWIPSQNEAVRSIFNTNFQYCIMHHLEGERGQPQDKELGRCQISKADGEKMYWKCKVDVVLSTSRKISI